MNQKNKSFSAAYSSVIVVFIGALSILNLYNHHSNLLSLSCLTSLIGLASVAVYFIRKKQYKLIMMIWALAQVLVIEKTYFNLGDGLRYKESIFDVSQVYQLTFGLQFGDGTVTRHFEMNVFAIGLLILINRIPLNHE